MLIIIIYITFCETKRHPRFVRYILLSKVTDSQLGAPTVHQRYRNPASVSAWYCHNPVLQHRWEDSRLCCRQKKKTTDFKGFLPDHWFPIKMSHTSMTKTQDRILTWAFLQTFLVSGHSSYCTTSLCKRGVQCQCKPGYGFTQARTRSIKKLACVLHLHVLEPSESA